MAHTFRSTISRAGQAITPLANSSCLTIFVNATQGLMYELLEL